ncbi:MAG: NAD-dependent epimerase/dehydratase family protein [Candidatus Aminicenantes bacterium]|nr:NAD-dependent epimerase/dehydratase family protein [Candidatus Aminicenantes bacterium]
MKNILITGGCGFLGQHLIHELLQDNTHRIKVLDLKDNEHRVYDHKDKVEYVLGKDIVDFNGIRDEFQNIEVVFHLAGFISFWKRHKKKLFAVNELGTRNVLQACLANDVQQVIYVSSIAALGFNDKKYEPVNEEFEFNWERAKSKPYMISKHKGELSALEYAAKGLNCIIANPGSMYGPGDVTNSSRLIKAIKDGKVPFNMPGGNNILDVRDVAKGLVKIMENGKRGERYLLSGYNYSFREINSVIADCAGVQPPKMTIAKIFHQPLYKLFLMIEKLSRKPLRINSDTIDSSFVFRYFDNSKARKELNWKPAIPYRQTIRDTIDWLSENQLI